MATNVEFLTEMMEFSDHGPMAQLFIIDAIDQHSARIAGMQMEELEAMFGPNAFISAKAWHGTAKEIQKKLKNRK